VVVIVVALETEARDSDSGRLGESRYHILYPTTSTAAPIRFTNVPALDIALAKMIISMSRAITPTAAMSSYS
jgi:hypothetical protein